MLGKGGMGDVWLADHAGLGCRVVVKFLSKELTEHEEALSRFKREASSAAAVKSPHVVQVFDHGVTAEGLPFIVMEYLEGRDLSKLVLKGPLPLDQVAEIVAQVAKALSRAHQVGIVHRDIKPENIFLCDSQDGETFVKILDFGIAKTESKASRATATGQIVGTPYYMSPEQIVGATVDAKVDLWSLAAVTYEMLTGRVAFDGDTVGAITLAIHGEAPVPSRLRPSLGPELDAWFAKAFAKDGSARFPNAKDMAAAFQQAARLSPEARDGKLSIRPPAPSIDLGASSSTQLPTDPRSSAGAMASTHLSSTLGVGSGEHLAKPRSRGAKVVLPVLGVAALVVAIGGWRAMASRSSAANEPDAPSATARASQPAPTEITSVALPAMPSAEPSAPASAASSLSPPASSASAALTKGKPAPGKTGGALPAKPTTGTGKSKPGKYDDIQ